LQLFKVALVDEAVLKDALKVVLNNITDCDSLQALGLRINNYEN